ncbi:hypothetical protein IDH31_00185 [Pelagibacterales bacterium SAG-MED32]|nr:hypothetical protein [Pelagibacterales bacterium SAG-MED32]
MLKIYKQRVDIEFIENINYFIDKYEYTDSLYFYSNNHEHKEVFNSIKEYIFNNDILDKKYLLDDLYIVIRCVKNIDNKKSFDVHFDNYKNTFLLPIKIPLIEPKGQFFIWENTRYEVNGILSHIFSKLFYQNFITRFLIRNNILKTFEKISCEVGDIVHFNGFNSLHYNEDVSSERRSILIHSRRGIKNSSIINLSERLSQIF